MVCVFRRVREPNDRRGRRWPCLCTTTATERFSGNGRACALVSTLARKNRRRGSGCRIKGETNGFSPGSFRFLRTLIDTHPHRPPSALSAMTTAVALEIPRNGSSPPPSFHESRSKQPGLQPRRHGGSDLTISHHPANQPKGVSNTRSRPGTLSAVIIVGPMPPSNRSQPRS